MANTTLGDSLLFTTKRPNTVMVRGEGMYLWDSTGKKYLDFIAGWAVNSLGHSPKVLSDVISKQAATLLNASPAFYNDQMLAFAQDLTANSCFDKVFFGSSGAEANESAIKLARKYGQVHKNGAYQIITMDNSFHGRTLATMSATGKAAFKPMFEPKVPGFVHVPHNDIGAVKAALSEQTCAVMLELIQGEGGVNLVDQEYIEELRRLCSDTNTLLIADEVQTGFGRTGTLFAYQGLGISPDIMTLGKGLGSGFPVSAMCTTAALDLFEPGEQGGTYTGQPLAMAVGRTVLNTILSENLCKNAQEMGALLQVGLREMSQAHGFTNVRGKGLLVAVDTTKNAVAIAEKCMDAGLLINASGPNTLRFIPALTLGEAHIRECLKILSEVNKSF